MGSQTDKTEKQQKTIFQSTCSPKGGSWLLRSLWRCPWRQSRCDLEEGATGTRGAAWHSLTNKALVAPGAVTPPATKQRHSYLTLPYLGVLELLWDHISLLGFVTDALIPLFIWFFPPSEWQLPAQSICFSLLYEQYVVFQTENYAIGLSF